MLGEHDQDVEVVEVLDHHRNGVTLAGGTILDHADHDRAVVRPTDQPGLLGTLGEYEVRDVIGQGGKELVVDFTDTTFIDSTTLGVLVGGVKRLRSNDGQLSLVCKDRNITKIFEITGLDRVFTIYPTRDEAVGAVGKTGSQPPA